MFDPRSAELASTRTTTTCGVCDTRLPRDSNPTIIDSACVCDDCMQNAIKPKFHAALDNERDYPARWSARIALSPDDYPGLLPESFRQMWHKRTREYNTPSAERLYCPHSVLRMSGEEPEVVPQPEQIAAPSGGNTGRCGAFLGARAVDTTIALVCEECARGVCRGCGEPLSSMSQHACSTASSAKSKSKCDEIEGLVRGIDFQIRLGCSMGAELRDGCNAVWCETCVIYFCYICGVQAADDSDHWRKGSAYPRYNARGAADAQFDRDDDEDGGVEPDDDTGDEEEDNSELESDEDEDDPELEDGGGFGLIEEFQIAEDQPDQDVDAEQQPPGDGLNQSHDELGVQESAAAGPFVGAVPVFRDFREFLHWRLNNTPAPEDT
ncbi:hypothetical protein LTR74_005718 [Friedmanniomyces endolithicus]|nr:hypothetical protein LTR74_005718 [Friedmanniomyces endolithicus]